MEPASSIALVSAISPVQQDASDRKSSTAVESLAHTRSDSAQVSKSEIAVSKHRASLQELPEDEVRVQRDSRNDGRIVIRYVDHSGNLILQIPSEQLLALARAVGEALAQKPESAGAAAAGQIEGQKESSDGNQS